MAFSHLSKRQPDISRLIDSARRWLGSDSHIALAQKVAGKAFAIRFASAGLTYLSQILLARWMGATEFGTYVYVLTWLSLLAALAPLGLGWLPQRFIPEYRAHNDLAHLRGYLLASPWLCFALGLACACVGTAIIFSLGHHVSEDYALPMLIALATLPIFTVSMTQESISNAHNWTGIALMPGYIARPLLMLAVLVVLQVSGMAVHALTAMIALLLAFGTTTIVQGIMLRSRLSATVPPGPRSYEVRRWLQTALPVLMVDGFMFLLMYIDVLLLKLFAPPEQVAQYYAASKTLAIAAFVYFAVSAACAHRFSEYSASKDYGKLGAFAYQSTQMMFWPSLAVIALLVVFGKWILMLFGAEFATGYPLILILATGLLARAAVGPAERLLSMVGEQKRCAAIYAAAVAINILLCLTLAPHLGPAGAAIATAGAMIAESILLSTAVRFRLNITMFIGRALFVR